MSTDRKQDLNRIVSEYYRCTAWQEAYAKKSVEFILPKIRGKHVLEMGCSTLIVSKMIFDVAESLEIVEGADTFVKEALDKFSHQVPVYHSLFEEFSPSHRYDAIVFTNTLHHIGNPEEMLLKIRDWLTEDGVLFITVPNLFSLHRQIGVQMGLLKDVYSATKRNLKFLQPGRFKKESLRQLCESCGYHVRELFGFFLKPFSDAQMAKLNPGVDLINALFELGRRYEEMASLLYVELTLRDRQQREL